MAQYIQPQKRKNEESTKRNERFQCETKNGELQSVSATYGDVKWKYRKKSVSVKSSSCKDVKADRTKWKFNKRNNINNNIKDIRLR